MADTPIGLAAVAVEPDRGIFVAESGSMFIAEERIEPGDVIGINHATGRVRPARSAIPTTVASERISDAAGASTTTERTGSTGTGEDDGHVDGQGQVAGGPAGTTDSEAAGPTRPVHRIGPEGAGAEGGVQ